MAVEDNRHHIVTKALEDVTFINIAVTGVIANITKSFSQSALGHMMYDGVRTFFTQEAKDALHGEIVAVALFTQLYYNKLSEQKMCISRFLSIHRSLRYATAKPIKLPTVSPIPYQISERCVAIMLPINVPIQKDRPVNTEPLKSSK